MYPILFTVGGLEIRAWGLFVALGICAGLWLTVRLGKGSEFTEDFLTEYVAYGAIAGILGARAWEVVFSWSQFAANPLTMFMFWDGGLSIQGAVAANVLFAWWYTKKKGISFKRFADLGTIGLILGQAIGRIGCFFNGDAFGIPTNAWYGVVYKAGTPAYRAWGAVPLVPAELFEAGLDLGILAVLIYVYRHKKFDGQVALLYFGLYSLARFSLEFFRSDSLMIGELKAAQMTALATAAIAAVMFVLWSNQRKSYQPAKARR